MTVKGVDSDCKPLKFRVTFQQSEIETEAVKKQLSSPSQRTHSQF